MSESGRHAAGRQPPPGAGHEQRDRRGGSRQSVNEQVTLRQRHHPGPMAPEHEGQPIVAVPRGDSAAQTKSTGRRAAVRRPARNEMTSSR
jgi:hypothetical protein